MNLNLQTDYKIWSILVYGLISLSIVMIRISEGLLESLGWKIISVFVTIGIIATLYRYLMP